MDIMDIINAIRENKVKITDHADEETQDDKLTYDEIFHSVFKGNIIENYIDDKPFPSCLISGKTFSGEQIHSVWAYNDKSCWFVLITVYRIHPEKWINGIKRRN